MSKFKIFAKAILIPIILGGIVGFIISNFIDYNSLEKPFLSPPSITFPIAWSILYILMGISYGILEVNSLIDSKINLIYYLQLSVNNNYKNNKIAGLLQVQYLLWGAFDTYLNLGIYLLNK